MTSNREKPSVWIRGLDRRDRLFLWWLSYRLPGPFEISPQVLEQACKQCKFSIKRARELQTLYPRAWARMMEKRHFCLTRQPDPTGDATPRRAANARMVGLLCNHPRMARKMRKAGVLA